MVGVTGAIDCFRLGLQCAHWNFCTLGVRSKRTESSRFSKSVARCTSFSVVSQMMSLIASFGSMRNKCCRILRNGISCGVSATCERTATSGRRDTEQLHVNQPNMKQNGSSWDNNGNKWNHDRPKAIAFGYKHYLLVPESCRKHPNVSSNWCRWVLANSAHRHTHDSHRTRPIARQHLHCSQLLA